MKYENIVHGNFISRPNRFIAEVVIDGEVKICHVKNTGRCRELLLPGTKVILQHTDDPKRKTEYDLIAVYKGDTIINIDSQAPNKVFGEWIYTGGFFKNITAVRPESKFMNSRFDFFIEADSKKIFAEIKGVTLENEGVVLFPDAPTERGIKHISELIKARENGYDAYIFFVVQMKNCKYFSPNSSMHPEFATTLAEAKKSGVHIYSVNCDVTEDELKISDFIDVIL